MATTAPQTLLDARRLLLEHLGRGGLESVEVGIVGDTAHQRQGDSYHLGRPEQRSYGYSVSESPRDAALTEFACALDIGTFSVRSGGATHTLRTFSTWLVAQCAAGTADTRDIREVIYSPDGRTVRRWDRLGKRSSGDSSHTFHTHISFHRDAIRAGRDQTPVIRRYLTTIGLIQGDDMPLTKADIPIIREALHGCEIGRSGVTMGAVLDLMRGMPSQVAAVRADVAGLAGRDLVDEQQVAVQLAPLVLAGLSPERIAAAIPAELARQVADELAARLAD
ncbi:hypothetical protein ACN27B_08770 [Micromonospora sp. WMMD754]|uniref:hypothetical protein n=1 Tax=Micromonospora sp. WMMD754 TaxID=3404114 RepID=UPI003BF548AF